jgi:hypothetical protein
VHAPLHYSGIVATLAGSEEGSNSEWDDLRDFRAADFMMTTSTSLMHYCISSMENSSYVSCGMAVL